MKKQHVKPTTNESTSQVNNDKEPKKAKVAVCGNKDCDGKCIICRLQKNRNGRKGKIVYKQKKTPEIKITDDSEKSVNDSIDFSFESIDEESDVYPEVTEASEKEEVIEPTKETSEESEV